MNMKKRVKNIGITTLLIFVFVLSVFIVITINQNIVGFQDIIEHLPKYIGKNVTIEGYVISAPIMNTVSILDSQSNPRYSLTLNVPNKISIVPGMYRIKGTVTLDETQNYPIIKVISAVAI